MALHKDLTGANIHEPKGVDAASASTVYLANGSGSGTWSKLPLAALDTTSIQGANRFSISLKISDLANASVAVFPLADNCTLIGAMSCITAAISGGDSVLTFSREGAATIGTITIAAAGSGEGILDVLSTPANNVFTAPSWLKISSDGGPTGGTSDAYILVTFEYN